MKSRMLTKTRLSLAMAVLLAPALASAQDSMNNQNDNNASKASATMNSNSTVRDPYAMQADAAGRDAYREGLIWGTYAANPALDAYRLGVDVDGNRAVLTGRVETAVDKLLAERIAMRAQGIQQVDNRIQVDPLLIVTMVPLQIDAPTAAGGTNQSSRVQGNGTTDGNERMAQDRPMRSDFSRGVSDDTLAAMVNSRLLWSAKTDGTDIQVKAHDGVVTLTGRADTEAAKNEATRLAQATRGTVRVDNRLTVDPNGQVAQARAPDGDRDMSDTWIEAKVNSSLMWSAGVDADDIDVDARNGVVVLTGVADSVAAKRQAVDLAGSVRGVQRVDASGLRIDAGSGVSQL